MRIAGKDKYMKNRKRKRILRSLSCLLCAVTIASVNTLVYAEPSSKELESKTSELQGELNSLNSELSSISKEITNTSSKIEELAAKTEKSKLDLAGAKLNEEAQYDSMKNRIKFMYEGGNLSLLEILFESENMSDFLNKAEYVTTISEYDREMLDELMAIRTDIEKKQKKLESQQKELAKLQKSLASQKQNLTAKIESTSGSLADYQAQLEKAKAAEAALAAAQDAEKSGSVKVTSDTKSEDKSENKDNKKENSGSSSQKPEKPVSSNTSDVALFAALLQCEAGGSGYDGMLAVATVVMNRLSSSRYPNTLKGVIYQSGQFAPTWNGSLNRVLASGASSTAYAVAQDALAGKRHPKVLNCYEFRAAWSTDPDRGVNVGGNIFF